MRHLNVFQILFLVILQFCTHQSRKNTIAIYLRMQTFKRKKKVWRWKVERRGQRCLSYCRKMDKSYGCLDAAMTPLVYTRLDILVHSASDTQTDGLWGIRNKDPAKSVVMLAVVTADLTGTQVVIIITSPRSYFSDDWKKKRYQERSPSWRAARTK